MDSSKTLAHIPTNVITGFLGVGKTTAIQHLLHHKPENERWAVLVNEFGEVGIDGGMVNGLYGESKGVYLREVPGGCMCCASGLPMQIALNMLLKSAKPDRLLIEPTGLGHPREVLAVLSGSYYRDLLDLRATLTLVDARKLGDARYIENPTFAQQLSIADVLVANKSDLYREKDHQALHDFLKHNPSLSQVPLHVVSQGMLDLNWLQGHSSHSSGPDTEDTPAVNGFAATSFAPQLPECGYLRVDNRGQGFNSCGWLFDADFLFDDAALHRLLSDTKVERIKGVFITEEEVVGYNKADDVLTRVPLDDSMDSRIELIFADGYAPEHFEQALLNCVVHRGR